MTRNVCKLTDAQIAYLIDHTACLTRNCNPDIFPDTEDAARRAASWCFHAALESVQRNDISSAFVWFQYHGRFEAIAQFPWNFRREVNAIVSGRQTYLGCIYSAYPAEPKRNTNPE